MSVDQQLICLQRARSGERYRLDRSRLRLDERPLRPLTHSSFLSILLHLAYLPVSLLLCGSTPCCLVTGWSDLDVIVTAVLIRPDPIFHLCHVYLSLSGCLRSGQACQMKSTRTNDMNNRQKAFIFWLNLSQPAQLSFTFRP